MEGPGGGRTAFWGVESRAPPTNPHFWVHSLRTQPGPPRLGDPCWVHLVLNSPPHRLLRPPQQEGEGRWSWGWSLPLAGACVSPSAPSSRGSQWSWPSLEVGSGRLWAPLLGSVSLPMSPCFFHVACIYWAPTGCLGAGDVAEGGTQALFLDLQVPGRPLGVPSVARVTNFLRPHVTRVECMCTPRTNWRK